jgi:hypothetical protein
VLALLVRKLTLSTASPAGITSAMCVSNGRSKRSDQRSANSLTIRGSRSSHSRPPGLSRHHESPDGSSSGQVTANTSAASWATSVGVVPTRTPWASSVSFFACAVPEVPEMIAPAWPMVLPGGAVKPAM